jgi:hypothetical protein
MSEIGQADCLNVAWSKHTFTLVFIIDPRRSLPRKERCDRRIKDRNAKDAGYANDADA